MSDLKRYTTKRKKRDPEFSSNFDEGYADFKAGLVLRKRRKKAGLNQTLEAVETVRADKKSVPFKK